MVVQLLKGNSLVGREVFEFETEYIQYRIQIRPVRDNGFVEQKYFKKIRKILVLEATIDDTKTILKSSN